ncbi:DNA/RNA non-specific endonuclease [Pseudoxanthomonas koreensis]|uniref:DNA/RNA non-specific endonuclease n=1 Tax=Pseudoxanthomonas koreensis TaxID=266061 RepID=UPI0035A592BF
MGAGHLETDGSIQNVFQVPAGSKNNWSRAINGSLEPNAAYKLDNGYVYVTDTAGRVKGVEGELSLSKMDRNAHQQCVVGKCGNAGDEGGHLIAASLGGAGDRINLVPQASTLNRGDWKAMENHLRRAIDNGQSVSVKIDLSYPSSGGSRPNRFQVTPIIDGKPRPPIIFNQ